MYVTTKEVGRLSLALADQGMEVFIEGDAMKVLLADGSYRKVQIIDLPNPNELFCYMMSQQATAMANLKEK